MDTVFMLKSCLRLAPRCVTSQSTRMTEVAPTVLTRWKHLQPSDVEGKPVKFTTSQAYIDYKATENFYGDDRDLPKSHNFVLAFSGIFGIVYLFLLRDYENYDGETSLFTPIHETVPELAIPMLKSAIEQNKKIGYDTRKLELKLAEYMKEPEKYGQKPKKLVEN